MDPRRSVELMNDTQSPDDVLARAVPAPLAPEMPRIREAIAPVALGTAPRVNPGARRSGDRLPH